MKKPQLIGVAIAGVCGLAAFVVAQKFLPKQQTQHAVVETSAKTASVLVARDKLGLGQIAVESSFRWQDWPDGPGQIPPNFVVRRGGGNPIKDYVGRIVRVPVAPGEPITDDKLIAPGKGGVLAAILPDGMRAFSTKITEDSAVGRLILPNDHVDVILTRRIRGKNGKEEHASDILFTNVRVLAIGQVIQAADGKKSTEGNTATLQLSPEEAERLAQAKAQGEISLALRSVLELTKDADAPTSMAKDKSRGVQPIRMLKYGVRSRAQDSN
jgi:pilus assembly protein CpaB